MKMDGRLDGHIVQGHVDKTGSIVAIENINGSYYLTFTYEEEWFFTTVPQGSITVNGISLTVADSKRKSVFCGDNSVHLGTYQYEYFKSGRPCKFRIRYYWKICSQAMKNKRWHYIAIA